MLLQLDYFETLDILHPILSMIILIFILIFTVVMYVKLRRVLPIFIVYVFSLFMGFYALSVGDIPFSPYFQMMFLLFQSVIMIMTLVRLKEKW